MSSEACRQLETVRQYGLDRLRESGETNDLRRRHRDWYLALAEQVYQEPAGPRSELWLAGQETEHDNMRTALEWSRVEKDGAEAGLRLTGALSWFWVRHGHWSEAREWLEGALARSAEAPPAALPRALVGASNLAWRQGDYERAAKLGAQGLALSRDLGDKEGSANLLLQLGAVWPRLGDVERATALLDECLNVSRELGNKWISGQALVGLGDAAQWRREYERAIALHTESLAEFRETGDKWGIARALTGVGSVAHDLNDYGRAVASFTESLTVCSEVGDRWLTGLCLAGLAKVASASGHHERAARLFGAAEVLFETLGWRLSPYDQASHEQRVAATRAALGEAAFAATWAEGRGTTLEQAIAYALANRAD